MKKIKILGIIPARGGSKRIPHKNIAKLGGKPLIYYTIREAKKSKLLDAFLVSTDSEKIAKVARSLGADVPFLRPKKYARDKSVDIEFLKHAVEWVQKHRGWRPEIVVLLRPTSPFRTDKDIDDAIRLIKKTKCDSVRTVSSPSPYIPYKMWFFDNGKTGKMRPVLKTKYFNRLSTDVPRQLLEPVWWQNGIVDVTRAKFIKRGRVYGPDIRGMIVDAKKVVDIDQPKDLKKAEQIMRELKLG